MYTILVTNNNELIVSVQERIMQRSKIVDSLHFLVEPTYKNINMSDFTVMMEYLLPVSKEYHTELLTLSEDTYKERLEYKLPFDTALTKEAGNIEVQLTFTKMDLDADGNSIQYVRKTSPCNITIVPISAWSDFVPDNALNALDQALLKVEGQIKALEEMNGVTATLKADNIMLNKETNELYLTADGSPIGDKISLGDLGDEIADATSEGLIPVII